MKSSTLFFLLPLVLFLSSCQDISEIQPKTTTASQSERLKPVTPPQTVYPISRQLTDSQGRTIDAQILGKKGIEIAIAKNPEGSRFVIPIEKLGREDQNSIQTLTDGGIFDKVKDEYDRKVRLAGRTARWHQNVDQAEREAAKLGIPLLLAILVTDDMASKNLERELMYSKTFREWANTNLVLSMLRVDDPESNRTTSFSAVEDRDTAARFGVARYDGPTVMLVQPNGGKRRLLSATSLMNGDAAIESVSLAIDSNDFWDEVRSVEAPKKARAKVNGGATFSDASGGG